jgi:hypothetical protein
VPNGAADECMLDMYRYGLNVGVPQVPHRRRLMLVLA